MASFAEEPAARGGRWRARGSGRSSCRRGKAKGSATKRDRTGGSRWTAGAPAARRRWPAAAAWHGQRQRGGVDRGDSDLARARRVAHVGTTFTASAGRQTA
ncbi:hypothetical protein Scep_007556 [Stephania cephalantha]|uniref:Uncharacterized protein n=1 Tax=Stephania cephalantha TaxID=152367 RepID=A0AAP0KBU3_9MAGN